VSPVIVSGGSVRGSQDGVLVDLSEAFEGTYITAAPTTTPFYDQAGTMVPFNQATSKLQVGAGFTLVNPDAAAGPLYVVHASGAATSAKCAAAAAVTPFWVFPFRLWGAAGGIVPAQYPRPMRRYQVDFLVRLPGARGTARQESGVVFQAATNSTIANVGVAGVAWTSDVAVNGGRWSAQVRTDSAGAVATLFDSGELPANIWRQLSIRYEERTNPRIAWLIDGIEVFSVAGAVNMPRITGGGSTTPFFPFQALTAPAGTTFNYGPWRYRVTEI
jgi:hypothetical protein